MNNNLNNYPINFNFLQEPIPISRQSWPENTTQFVSISCLTYNHVDYIRDAIEGFLMQKTTFPVKIVIFDDCSTDGNQEVLRRYQKKYPQLFHITFAKENTYKKPMRREALKPRNIERAKAKYIAFCEGDDYWTDPLKLQKQVDFMETNPDCSMCYHGIKALMIKEGEKSTKVIKEDTNTNLKFSSEEFIKKRKFARTLSRLIKTSVVQEIPSWFYQSPIGDYPLQMLCALNGNIGYIGGEPMAVYRRGVDGSTNHGMFGSQEEQIKWLKKRLYNHKKSRDVFNENSDFKYDQYIRQEKQHFALNMLFKYFDLFKRQNLYRLYKEYVPNPYAWGSLNVNFWVRFFLGTKLYNLVRKIKK